MFAWFPYRVRLLHPHAAAPPGHSRGLASRKRARVVVGMLLAAAATVVFPLPVGGLGVLPLGVLASNTGSVTATIPIAVISLTVTPSTATFDNCDGGNSTAHALGFPNGSCSTILPLVVTNTGAASHIQVQGSDAAPSTGSPIWNLCFPGGSPKTPACSGPANFPGTDEFSMLYRVPFIGSSFPFSPLSKEPRADQNFGVGGAAPAGATATEPLAIVGPFRSTNNSTSFTATVTWIAIL